MEYSDVVKDFAERTLVNLRQIESLSESGYEAYEVTQLINSLLGLLIFPKERFHESIPEIP